MIIWLASYPRSGNTLLRTIIKQCFDLRSYSDEEPPLAAGLENEVADEIGDVRRQTDWPTFYDNARSSDELFLIKTHLAPIDDAPAIYVYRDGRSAIESYAKYHKNVHIEANKSIDDLIFGDDYYGGWSAHYKIWQNRPKTLYLAFQDIVEPSSNTLGLIATHLSLGNFDAFSNPIAALQQKNESFFGQAKKNWELNPEFGQSRLDLFSIVHGETSVELDYQSAEELSRILSNVPISTITSVKKIEKLLSELRQLRSDLVAKEQVINELVAVIQKKN